MTPKTGTKIIGYEPTNKNSILTGEKYSHVRVGEILDHPTSKVFAVSRGLHTISREKILSLSKPAEPHITIFKAFAFSFAITTLATLSLVALAALVSLVLN